MSPELVGGFLTTSATWEAVGKYIYIYICPVLDKNKYWTKTTANEWSMPEACRKKMWESMNQHYPDTGWFVIKCIFSPCSQD